MADVFSTNKRSLIMASVKSKENISTERALVEIFNDNEIKGWRRNYSVIGKPDFLFLKKRIAVFADGCFWHGHNCRNLIPKNNSNYWAQKIIKNKNRDNYITGLFKKRGWTVIRYWECEIKQRNIDLSLLL